MVGRINDEDIRALRERANIGTVIGEYTALKRAGSTLKGLCPFHTEKSPSFTVNPSRGLFHCLAGETGVMTWEGTVPIAKLAGATHRLLTIGGDWIDAEVRGFGVQPLQAVHLSRNRMTKTINATAEHLWFVRQRRGPAAREQREVRTTAQLRPGDRLAHVFTKPDRFRGLPPAPLGVAQGFTFGDGGRSELGSRADFHGEKDRQLLPYFAERADVRRMGDGRLVITRLPRAWKELPELDDAVGHLYGWLAGYLAADGCVSADGQVVLSSAEREHLEFVRTLATRLGIGTYGIKTQQRMGYGSSPSALHHLTFITSMVPRELLILDHHRERFDDAMARERIERRGWVVTAVEDTDRVEEVFCAVVSGTHAFALEDNILTHNCFGCGEGGDVYAFLQKLEALTFPESVERLARMVGHDLRYEELSPGQRKAIGRRTRLTEATEEAANFFASQLASPAGADARAYLTGRGLTADDAARFRLGWAPDAWDDLVQHLHAKGFGEDTVEAGLATEGRRGLIDRFRGRVIFPIVERSGRDVVAFGGRILPGKELQTGPREGTPPKYINSSETEVYKKSETLYALNWARADIQKQRTALVVEGYMDVIGLHLAGIRNVVATCGTALTADHFRQLEKFAPRVVLALDADDAGFAAADRARALAEEVGMREVGVLPLPAGQDPADLAADGAAAVEAALQGTKTALQFQIEHLLRDADVETPEGQIDAYRRTFPLLAKLPDRFLRFTYIRDVVAPAVRLSADRIERELDADPQAASAPVAPPPTRPPDGDASDAAGAQVTRLAGIMETPRGPQMVLEREVLRAALQHPDLLPAAWAEVQEADFTAPVAKGLFQAIADAPSGQLDTILERLPDDDSRARVRALALSDTTVEPDLAHLGEVVARLRAATIQRAIDAVRAELATVNPTTDPERNRALLLRHGELEQGRRQLLERQGA